MLGKCLWKIHRSPVTPDSPAGFREVLAAYSKALQCVPEKRDNRHPERDPILEPHYKLVSFVHKLVQRRFVSVSLCFAPNRTRLNIGCSQKKGVGTWMPPHMPPKYLMCKMPMIGKATYCQF